MSAEMSETPVRVYKLTEARDLEFLGAADDVSLTDLLLDQREKGVITDATQVGIMWRPIEGGRGVWLANPFA